MWLAWITACGGVRADRADGLVLNELLARNLSVNADEADEFDDWVEIWNGGDAAVSRDDVFLSDDAAAPDKWPLPKGAPIKPGEFLLVWCDGQPEQGEMHASFKLGGSGESVVLSLVADEPVTIDEVDFPAQDPDVAWARLPDGGVEWSASPATPGESNGG